MSLGRLRQAVQNGQTVQVYKRYHLAFLAVCSVGVLHMYHGAMQALNVRSGTATCSASQPTLAWQSTLMENLTLLHVHA